jgi:chromosomal replication initiator protein
MTSSLETQTVTVEDILEVTSLMFGFSVEDLLGPTRWRNLVRARHFAIYVCRHQMGLSYPAIAKAFNRQDHTTVMHAVSKIDDLIIRDRNAASQVVELTARVEVEGRA